MTRRHSETIAQKLVRLRQAVEQVQSELIEAEAELVDRQAEVNAFEFEFEARVGYLLDQLVILDQEIDHYNDLIETIRNRQVFGNAYLSIEKQYQRAWERPSHAAPIPPTQPPSPATEAEIKQLYRQLARRFHPDLATGETDRVSRTEKMAALNNAYAARNLTELMALAQEADYVQSFATGQTEAQMVKALEGELERCRRRLKEIRLELQALKGQPSVRLSLDVKLARRRGEDLLGQMATDLSQKIARKTVERDILKNQVDRLGPDQGFIPIPLK